MKNFISIEEFDNLSEKEKELYEVTYLDYETKCVPQGYVLKKESDEMKKILLIILLTALTACATRQINNKQQTFTDYVILNGNSNYKGKSMKDWDNQPAENFIGIRLINWFKSN